MNDYLKKTRQQIIAEFGEPTDVAITRRKDKFPSIFKYGNVELHFTNTNHDGTVWLVYSEDEKGNPTTHAKC